MRTDNAFIMAWDQADAVGHTVAIILLVMSLLSWIVFFYKGWKLLRYKRMARVSNDFWRSPNIDEGIKKLGNDADNPFLLLALEGHEAARHRVDPQTPYLKDSLNVSDWITGSLRYTISNFTARLQSGLIILATVGSIAPFIGLFGTVWGIIHALLAISASGQASIDTVAGPIGEALFMTAFGLAVAIPAVIGYNILVRANKSLLLRLNSFSHDLHAYFLTGSCVAHNGQTPQASPKASTIINREV